MSESDPPEMMCDQHMYFRRQVTADVTSPGCPSQNDTLTSPMVTGVDKLITVDDDWLEPAFKTSPSN